MTFQRLGLLASWLLLGACSSAQTADGGVAAVGDLASATAPAAAAESAPLPLRSSTPPVSPKREETFPNSASNPSPEPKKSTVAARKKEPLAMRWEQQLKEPSLHIAFGKKRSAVLVGQPGKPIGVWMHDRNRWRALPFPSKLLASAQSVDQLEVFFGRDDRPRTMGYRQIQQQQRQLYYRWKGNWRAKAGEIGRLDGGKPAALFGILGHDDPEVVCKLGDICIIKRLTGWTMVPVPAAIHRVAIASGKAYAVGPRSGLWMTKKDKRWRPLATVAPWSQTHALWATPDGKVTVCADDGLFHLGKGSWNRQSLPGTSCTSLLVDSQGSLWVVGSKQIHQKTATGWRELASPCKAIHHATANRDAVWLACSSGLWRHDAAEQRSAGLSKPGL